MRILHIANFSWFGSRRKRADDAARYYSTERKITNGLVRNGHCVWDFSYRDAARYLSPPLLGKKSGAKKMNAAVLTLAQQFSPQLVLLGHCELLHSDTLAELCEKLPQVKVAQWWVDWFMPHSLRHLREKQPYLDAFFATSAPTYFCPLLGDNPVPAYYLPNITDSSVETERAFARDEHEYDVFFAGADAPERAALLRRVENMPDVRPGFFGFGGRPLLGGAALAATIGTSRIGLNLSRATDIPLYTSDRLAQLTGNGCLALTPRTPGMNTLFAEDEVAYFNGEEELTEVLTCYLQDDAARRKIAEAGWRRAHKSYNERRVARFVVEATLGGDFSETYEWLTPKNKL